MRPSLTTTLLTCTMLIGTAQVDAQLPLPEEATARCTEWLEQMRGTRFTSVANLTYGDERPADGTRGAFLSARPVLDEDTALCVAEVLVFAPRTVDYSYEAEVWSFEQEIARDPARRDPDDPPLLGWTRGGSVGVEAYQHIQLGECVEVQRGTLLRICEVTLTRGNEGGPGWVDPRPGLVVTDPSGFPLGAIDIDARTFDDEDGPQQVGSMTWEVVGGPASGAVYVMVTRRIEASNHVAEPGSCEAAIRRYTYADLLRWDGATWQRLASVPTDVSVESPNGECRAFERGRLDVTAGGALYELVLREVHAEHPERLDVRLPTVATPVSAEVGEPVQNAVPLPFDDAGSVIREPAELLRCEELVRTFLGGGGPQVPVIGVAHPEDRGFWPHQADFVGTPATVESSSVSQSATGAWQCSAEVSVAFYSGEGGVQFDRGQVWLTTLGPGGEPLRAATWLAQRGVFWAR